MKTIFRNVLTFAICTVCFAVLASAQTTSFTYQGSLNVSGQPANGNFDFIFALFAAESGGSQLGSVVVREGVQVVNGDYTVTLDFGSQFPGADRFLEIGARTAGNPAGFTILSPRRRIDSSPYSVRSLSALNAVNATQLNGVAANQYVQTNDARLSDARQPLPGSPNYIQNSTPQSGQSFNVTGSGSIGGSLTANTVAANSEFRIGLQPVLRAGPFGLSVGLASGPVNGQFVSNSFFGNGAGRNNEAPTYDNTLIGYNAGDSITTGFANTFVGSRTGGAITIGANNTFLGATTGQRLVTGSGNTFIGAASDFLTSDAVGTANTLLGFVTKSASGLNRATAVGSLATVTRSDSIVLGAINGVNSADSDTNVGIGTTAPTERLHIAANGNSMLVGGGGCPSGNIGIGLNGPLGSCTNYTVRGDGQSVYINRPTGGFVFFREGNGSSQVLINPGGALELRVLGTSGGTALCRNATQEVAFCSSSLRYKKNIVSYAPGMSFIRQLQPIAYEWKADGMKDVGFGAEDVAKIDPRFVTYTDKGEVEGIKYDRMSAAFVNAFREQESEINTQRAEIESLRKQVDQQKAQIAEMKALICSIAGNAAACSVPK